MYDARGKTGMGIKPSYIKRLGEELIVERPERFGRDFKENKLGVSENAIIGSKKVRNRVAGYITRKHNTGKKT
jgi:small subunit ribosomal protein S17e